MDDEEGQRADARERRRRKHPLLKPPLKSAEPLSYGPRRAPLEFQDLPLLGAGGTHREKVFGPVAPHGAAPRRCKLPGWIAA